MNPSGFGRTSLTALIVAVNLTLLHGQQPARVTLHVVDRGAQDAPVSGVDVRVFDASGREIQTGITNPKGDFAVQWTVGQKLTFEYQKIGFVRRPERIQVVASATSMTLAGPLIQLGKDRAYYSNVSARVQRVIERTPVDSRRQVIQDEKARVAELPLDMQLVAMNGDWGLDDPQSQRRARDAQAKERTAERASAKTERAGKAKEASAKKADKDDLAHSTKGDASER